MKKTISLILGGGQGKRLFPLTEYRSKPAVPIGGKYRLIDIPISHCLRSGIKDIYVLTQFNSESLNNHINNTYRFDYFSRAFVRILAAEQTLEHTDWYEGTADAVRKSMAHLNLKGNEEILILSGDHLYNMDYREIVSYHRRTGADITVSVIPIKEYEVKEFGILKLSKNNRIIGFKEKPKKMSEIKGFRRQGSYMASMGVYIFNARVLTNVLEGNDVDFGHEIIPHSIKTFKAFAYPFNGYWRDIGTIKSFYEANMELAAYKPHFSFFYGGAIFSRPRFLPPACLLDGNIARSIIAEGSVIKDADIKNSIIGLRTMIGNGCKVNRAIVMGADYYEEGSVKSSIKLGIGDGTVIDTAIVDKNARIGKNVIIKNLKNLKNFDGQGYFIRDGIVIIPKNGLVKDGNKI
ncbi:MAG: glucose-1-phosphate adenylyltransferase [Candidatus Omnitrophica bacterium]|nr:glucose-1-phosphate adenylyltransferase [Candidatus Omnitrophota bacterium]